MSDNGQKSRPQLSPELLTPRDMLRAETALAEVLGDRSPYDMLEDAVRAVPFTIWCLRSRTDPGFTWEQALDTPFLGEFEPASPPQIPSPAVSGSSPAKSDGNKSRREPAATATAHGSASTSG